MPISLCSVTVADLTRRRVAQTLFRTLTTSSDLLPALKKFLGSVLLAFALIGGALPAAAQTLDAVRTRGYVVCGSSDPLAGFAQLTGENRWSGFDVDFCRAIAAAVFGDPARVEFRPLQGDARFAQLQTGALDVIVRNSAWTMRRDTGYGANYVGTSFFDGQAFLVPQTLNVVSAFELNNVSVCVLDGGDELTSLRDFFFQNQLAYREVLYEDREDLRVAYEAGRCNAVSAAGSFLHAIRRSLPDAAAHRILPERISKEAFGPVVRNGDDQWFNIVRWTLFALIDAEELGVTSNNVDALSAVRTPAILRFLGIEADFGTPLGLDPLFMANIIRAVGNYGEMFDRHFGAPTGPALPRGYNSLWTQGGLIYSPPIR